MMSSLTYYHFAYHFINMNSKTSWTYIPAFLSYIKEIRPGSFRSRPDE